MLIELSALTMKNDDLNGIPEGIHRVLHLFGDVFQVSSGLPPAHEHDHTLILKEGSKPINVRPFCYPHAQKIEIRRLVNEMLEAGMIWLSISPFSSPVLLAKKKDDN